LVMAKPYIEFIVNPNRFPGRPIPVVRIVELRPSAAVLWIHAY
jgi:hypothetical protein